MSYGRMIGWAVMGFFVSGCASGPSSQAISRLRSQVGMLEERVSQLEHAGAVAAETAASPEASAMPVAAPDASKPEPPAAAATKHFAKPSTRDVQQALKNAGFYQGETDGKMGPATHEAVKQFQRAQGLKEDGIVGRHTWAKLSTYLGGEAPAPESLK